MKSLDDLIHPDVEVELLYDVNAVRQITALGFVSGVGARALRLEPGISQAGDLSSDCSVNVDDLILLIQAWSQPDSNADLNDDATVDVLDLIILLNQWTF